MSTGSALASPLFRRIWSASMAFNLGMMILSVSAAWSMTQMTSSPGLVALVQTGLLIPIMLFAIPAGAIADMYDRRVIALVALGIAIAGATLLIAVSALGQLTPMTLLCLVFLIGTGLALTGPASQAAISEQVPPAHLPSAVALNAISVNVARSFGPAIGGVVVAATGALVGFAITACFLLPFFLAFFAWRRVPVPSRLPPERIAGAMLSGIRFILHSPPVRVVLVRMFVGGLAFGSLSALMPLVARDLLHGGAGMYGTLLGAIGVGAVVGVLNIARVRQGLTAEFAVAVGTVVTGLGIVGIGLVHHLAVTLALLLVIGAFWTTTTSLLNIAMQLSAPRWVAGRCLAAFSAAMAGGLGLGAGFWGRFATTHNVSLTLIVSGSMLVGSALLGFVFKTPTVNDASGSGATEIPPDPEVRLGLTTRSGPIVIEICYHVPTDQARAFYAAVQKLQRVRQRNGGYGWSIARDIAHPELWVERFHCPTWLDYLHQRARVTQNDRQLDIALSSFRPAEGGQFVRRLLERPFGSVRWKDDAPDIGTRDTPIAIIP